MGKKKSTWVVVVAVYLLSHLPLVLDRTPGWYHKNIEIYTFQIAISTIKHGLPYELVLAQSFAGYNLHAVAGAPFFLLGGEFFWIRVPNLIAGGLLIGVCYAILGEFDEFSQTAKRVFLALLLVTPHFIVYTGYAVANAFTLLFTTGSILTYLWYLRSPNWRLAAASGLLVGIATFHHFWAGFATVTIGLFDALVVGTFLAADRRRDALETVRARLPVYVSHGLALVPGVLLFVYYQTSVSGFRGDITVEKYTSSFSVIGAPGELFVPFNYVTLAHMFIFLPLAPVAVLLVVAWLQEHRSLGAWIHERERTNGLPRVSARGFLALWLFVGAFVTMFFFPGLHDYYIWWWLVPSLGILALEWRRLDVRRLREYEGARLALCGLFAVLLVATVATSGLFVTKPIVDDPDSIEPVYNNPVIQRQITLGSYTDHDHANALVPVLSAELDENDRALVTVRNRALYRTAFTKARVVELGRVIFVFDDPVPSREGFDFLLTEEPVGNRTSEWARVDIVTTDKRTTYVYEAA